MHRQIERQVVCTFFWGFGIVSLAAVCFRMVVGDPDIWGHLLYGLEHLRTGALAHVDPYSYTAEGRQWINHEWLAELIFALAWRSLGDLGFWLLRLVLIGITLGVVLRLIFETTQGLWSGLILFTAALIPMLFGFSFRPQLFSFGAFALAMLLVWRIFVQRRWSVYAYFWFVPLQALWANLHGGFLVGLALLAYVVVAETATWIGNRAPGKRPVVVLVAAGTAAIATLANPGGIELWLWLSRSLGTPRGDRISEWRGVLGFGDQNWSIVGYYLILVIGLALFLHPRVRKSPFEWVLLLATACAAWMQARHVVFFAMLAAVILPKHLESALPRLKRVPDYAPLFTRSALVVMMIAAVSMHTLPNHRPNVIWVQMRKHPYNAFSFIDGEGLDGNLLVFFNWAQAAIWYLYPDCKVAFDGRFRTVYPKEIENGYFHFQLVDEQWSWMLDHYETQVVLMRETWPGIEKLRQRQDWKLAYRSPSPPAAEHDKEAYERAVIFIKRGGFPEFEKRLERGEVTTLPARKRFRFAEPLKKTTQQGAGGRAARRKPG